MWQGAAQRTVPRLTVKGAFGVGFADRVLADPALDSEPLAAPWRGETAGGAEKDAPPALRATPHGQKDAFEYAKWSNTCARMGA